jgi:coproporphyrinogen III oxidase
MTLTKEQIADTFRSLQDQICIDIEKADGQGRFHEDLWTRSAGGGGRSRVIENGQILEKGGVMFSAVWGDLHEKMLASMGVAEQTQFFATGVSIVMHPHNPHVPIIHMNVRYFEMDNGTCWFGGGIDLTPHYVDADDARWFHQQLKAVCDAHDVGFYARFKPWADDYFFNNHRQETRGVGGIFFDYLKPSSDHSQVQLFDFVCDVGRTFAPIYTHFMQKNAEKFFVENEKKWQLIRRGRYVEFNLVYDRGTKFGLETNGRTESILMSMPPTAQWHYNQQPAADSPEAQTLAYLRKGIDWV